MFELNDIITFTMTNIQIIGVFIAIIGGLVANKILNLKIERDILKEKLSKIEKEIDFNISNKEDDSIKKYEINKKEYILYIYDKFKDKNFNIEDYDDYDLSFEQRKNIKDELNSMIHDAKKIFSVKHSGDEVPNILQQNHIKENTIEYIIYEDVGIKTRERKNTYMGIMDTDNFYLPIENTLSAFEKFEIRDLNNRIDKYDELIKWKKIEKEDVESKLSAINSVDVKIDVILFVLITVFAIVIPQLVLCIYPLFRNFKALKDIFAIYSILVFVISMAAMICYMIKLLLKK